MFVAHGQEGAEIVEGGTVARGTGLLGWTWARTGTGFREGAHTWRLRVRGVRTGECLVREHTRCL